SRLQVSFVRLPECFSADTVAVQRAVLVYRHLADVAPSTSQHAILHGIDGDGRYTVRRHPVQEPLAVRPEAAAGRPALARHRDHGPVLGHRAELAPTGHAGVRGPL